jgi:hypothetical protein
MPEEALALARRVKPDDTGAVGVLNQRAAALALIARWLPPAQAAPLWREIIPTVGAQQAARYALSAYEQDPVLGRELFEVARGLLPPSNDRFAYRPYRDAVTFAFYLAPAEPAQSRVLLENTWVEAASKKNSSGLFDVARAMARLDANRALEMAKAIPDDDGFLSLEARRKIAQWVEADETQRRDWPFDRWGASDTWTPGDEEW